MIELLKKHKLVAVIRENTYEQAKYNIQLLINSGVKIIEITLTTPKAIELIKEFSNNKKDVIIGAGTVLNTTQAQDCKNNGANFLVSPYFSNEISQYATKNKISYLPGVFTPTEAYNAFELGNKVLKVFPSGILTSKFISDLKKPFPQIEFMPSGGVDLTNIEQWFLSGCLAVSVGSNLLNGNSEEERLVSIKKYLEIVKKW
ncbi:bifunctional 4-hydroxy-2-oxoglutarate aldolase/2-dehydro-3-deoxy-phosphogluconate aldolase [Mycoplasma crocodyli]|uniref:Khg/kdpg aldolase n=1 Tax=Mycoplasma crocodyli (strain ATCC 51981 / MP145) TaxID=512564 RepID=D5E5I3_MYCCM|nr:bifunctional 4-hydroxy-2-oxoglutarate aldolase/2-dehydro-3-deoxy-phosphogluconate aldolase [Mycoplasma crocodyli]ADE19857.1 khg/kdpg aldolase [Mycoplasma crocodyli MP145]